MPVIEFLRKTSPNDSAPLLAAFQQGLNETDFVEHHNVGVEYRWAQNRDDRLPGLASDLVRRQVAAILASGDTAALAAKAATSIIPIVFVTGADPIQAGVVASLNWPGGNITGV
jgi:putative ABC transport system substrate-binding protein